VPVGEGRYQPYQAIPGDEPYEPPPPELYVRPPRRARTGTLAAFLAPLVVLGATRPGLAFVALAGLVVLCRIAGTASDSLHARRERYGAPRRSDAVVAGLRFPWHAIAGALGAIPQLLVAGCVGVLTVIAGFWLLGDGRLILLPRTDVAARAVGGMNATIVFCGVLALAALVAALTAWFGPAGRTGREGARVLLGTFAPGWLGAAVVVAACLVAAWILSRGLLDMPPVIDPWPFTELPRF
jgi:hypothetical protein